jgi:hypothetical protein
MTMKHRLERLEVEAHRRQVARYLPEGWTLDAFLGAAIAWLEMPLEQQRASMPQFTDAELAEIRGWLPCYRRARWARR